MTRERKRLFAVGGLLGAGFATGLLVGLEPFGALTPPPWLVLLLVVAAVVVGFGVSLFWWRHLDEVAREAHKFAWYWGGSGGLALGLALVVFVDIGGLAPPLLEGSSVREVFVAGALSVMVAQVAGYAAAWAGWWWARR
ncbi:hypothetical protein [Phenylobacterium sp.]|uniref:hypothetical protein n=1 Tax=Phenylobacterium sp. TaxID=1871053 RepID=UPI0037C6CC17